MAFAYRVPAGRVAGVAGVTVTGWPFTATTEDAVRELINKARSNGYALLEQQIAQRVRGIAVPIRTRDGIVVGSISVSLPMGNETTENAVARALPLLKCLSPSERKVAGLVASGLRNDAIAERLCRSRKTIESQISSIFRKLNVSNRTQLARLLN